jgi:hypothetical protein
MSSAGASRESNRAWPHQAHLQGTTPSVESPHSRPPVMVGRKGCKVPRLDLATSLGHQCADPAMIFSRHRAKVLLKRGLIMGNQIDVSLDRSNGSE